MTTIFNIHRIMLSVAAGAQFLSQYDGIPRWLKITASVLSITIAAGVSSDAVRGKTAVEPTAP